MENAITPDKNSNSTFDLALEKNKNADYLLKLYIAGNALKSARAIEAIKKVCEEHLEGRYSLEVIDLYNQPSLASSEQIIAAPTLVKQMPLPVRKIIGDMADTDKVMTGLDLRRQDPPDHESETRTTPKES